MKIFPIAIGLFIGSVELMAGDDGYLLELTPSVQSVQVGENVQIGLRIR